MSIKVGDIVVNLLDASKIGQYNEKYDVRVVKEMITENKYAEVLYIDEDGAIITKEFGPYAYPADDLRLANEEEIVSYSTERYTVKIKYNGEMVTLPLEMSKNILLRGVLFGNRNVEANESLANYLIKEWNGDLKSNDDIKKILMSEVYEVLRKRAKTGSCSPRACELARIIFEGRNNDLKIDLINNIYENPLKDKGLYKWLEESGIEIPEEYATKIKEVSGYYAGVILNGTKLEDWLKDNPRYQYDFIHYGKLIVTKKGVNMLFDLHWQKQDIRAIMNKLNLNMESLKYFLENPRRDFSISLGDWFSKLDWEDIQNDEDMFSSCLRDPWRIKDRVVKGKFVPVDLVMIMMAEPSTMEEYIRHYGERVKNKSELKLKDIISHLDSLQEDVKISDFRKEIKQG